MPAPKHNKNAIGNKGGAPRVYDRIQIGKDFVKWATNNPEALTVPMFACTIGMHSGVMRDWAKDCIEFNALFIQGKEQIGINRLKATLSNAEIRLDPSIYRAHVHNYDQDLKCENREEKMFDASLKVEDIEKNSPEVIGKLEQMMKLMKNNQERSIEENKTKADKKS